MFTEFDKAIVGAVAAAFAAFIDGSVDVVQLLIVIAVGAGLVWLTPNKSQ